MSELKNMEDELDPRLRRMLNAYGIAPERDPETARRDQERFVAILNMIFNGRITPKPATGWFDLSAWPSNFHKLRVIFVGSRTRRAILESLILLIAFTLLSFSGVGMTVYAANSSLPGDALYPLKTTVETTRARLTLDPAAQARLYTEFAGRRVSEIQTLSVEGRYGDIAQASAEFERNLQRVISIIEDLSQTAPARAVVVRAEMASILQGYPGPLKQMLEGLPVDVQPVIQHAINASQSAIGQLDVEDDLNDDEDDETDGANAATPTPQSGNTPQLPGTIQPLPEASATLQITAISTPLSPATEPPPLTATPVPPATQVPADTGPVIQGGDGICQGSLGAVTVENLEVPQGASCTLDGTRVQGNIFVRNGASLTARGVTIIGNIQAEGASLVEVLAGSTVGGSIQLKQGDSAQIANVTVNGDIQFESNDGVLSASGNQVGGSIQVFQNVGGVTIAHNTINGNLQCKENNPAPTGGNNVVQGNKEDQCAGL